MSQSAVSIAASASDVIAPTAVAWVWKNSAFQIASIWSGSRPISLRREVARKQLDDGVAAGADGVGVAGADRAVVGEDADERRLLAGEGLDRVGPLHLGHEVDHEDLDPLDPCHRVPPVLVVLERVARLCGRLRRGLLDRVDAAHDRLAGRLVAVVVRHLADDAEAVHDQDAVGERDHLRHVAGDEDDRDAAGGDLADQLVEVGLGLDVDADRRLVDDQDVGIGGEPLGDRHLLLVAAGEVADRLAERRRADLEPLDEGLDGAGLRTRRDQAEERRRSAARW